MKDVIVLFIEGYTEVEFYKKVISLLREKNGGRLMVEIKIKNMKGIGNYQDGAVNYIKKKIIPHFKDYKIHVIICYDTDAFDLSKKPPVQWKTVKNKLLACGVDSVKFVKAHFAIEDWFLLDKNNLLKFLHLQKKTSIPSGKGQDVLKALFKKSNKVYIKGGRTVGLIDSLDIQLIMCKVCADINPICEELKISCKDISKKIHT